EVHAPGAVAVMARTLASVVSTLPAGDVAISSSGSGESLRLMSGSSAFRLQTLDAGDFPSLSAPARADLSIATRHLIDLIERTTFCAVDSEEASLFAGVLVTANPDSLEM